MNCVEQVSVDSKRSLVSRAWPVWHRWDTTDRPVQPWTSSVRGDGVPGVMGGWGRCGPLWYPMVHLRVPSGSVNSSKFMKIHQKSRKSWKFIKNHENSSKHSDTRIKTRTRGSKLGHADRRSDGQTVGHGDSQTVGHGDSQTVRQSDTEIDTVRQSDTEIDTVRHKRIRINPDMTNKPGYD